MSLRVLLRRCRALSAMSVLALSTHAVGCGTEDVGDESDDVTDIKNSDVKKQAIGNCWSYAVVGWAESLHLTHSGDELDLSESWITYWHWYEQITGAGPADDVAISRMSGDEISTGGWFGVGVEVLRRYGVITEGAFIPSDEDSIRSSSQSSALKAINRSLADGALSDPAARRDRALVRKELDKAWALTPEVTALLDDTFGVDVSRSLVKGEATPADERILDPNTIPVGEGITLADAIGEPASTWDVKRRKGTYAWNEQDYPSSQSARRELLRQAQKAMHAGMPVIMTWFVDFAALKDNVFLAPPEEPGRQGGHMTVLEDYEIDNVPGYGTLPAGELVTDPAILDAALAEEAQIKFFRIKNSWGTELAPQGAGEEFRGYHDLFLDYLDGPLDQCIGPDDDKCSRTRDTAGLWGLILPPAAFVSGGQGANGACHDVCELGSAMDMACEDSCVQTVCAQDSYCCDPQAGEWDSQCQSEAVSWCSLSCG